MCRKLFADSAYAGPKLQDALKDLGRTELIEIVPKPKGAKGFTVLSRRWVWIWGAAVVLPRTLEDGGKFSGSWPDVGHESLVARSQIAA